MFRFLSILLFIISALINQISADTCFCDGGGGSYYCSAGQSCGFSCDDCQGLPTYALIGIISTGITLLLICIRCCIRLNYNNTPPIRQRGVPITRNPRLVRAQVYSCENNMATRPTNGIPVHNIREEAPPSYDEAISINTELPKH